MGRDPDGLTGREVLNQSQSVTETRVRKTQWVLRTACLEHGDVGGVRDEEKASS